MKKNKRIVVVTTDNTKKGVFYGELVKHTGDTVVLKNARMAVYWSTETKSVLGLSAIGPQKGSRISPPVPQLEVNGVTSIADCSQAAIAQWEAGLWT